MRMQAIRCPHRNDGIPVPFWIMDKISATRLMGATLTLLATETTGYRFAVRAFFFVMLLVLFSPIDFFLFFVFLRTRGSVVLP